MSKEVIRQALEALEAGEYYIDDLEAIVYAADDLGTHEDRAKMQAAITVLREALAKPDFWEGYVPEPTMYLESGGLGYGPAPERKLIIGYVNKSEQPVKPATEQSSAEQPAKQEPWADKCRIDLVTAIHFLASDFENALGAFGSDTEARRKAEGDIAYARIVASRWNWNGTTEPAQQSAERVEPVDWEAVASDQAMTIALLKAEQPAQRKPLTEEEIEQLASKHLDVGDGSYATHFVTGDVAFARAIEAKLKEKNNG